VKQNGKGNQKELALQENRMETEKAEKRQGSDEEKGRGVAKKNRLARESRGGGGWNSKWKARE
jgi:hypothetical protein